MCSNVIFDDCLLREKDETSLKRLNNDDEDVENASKKPRIESLLDDIK